MRNNFRGKGDGTGSGIQNMRIIMRMGQYKEGGITVYDAPILAVFLLIQKLMPFSSAKLQVFGRI